MNKRIFRAAALALLVAGCAVFAGAVEQSGAPVEPAGTRFRIVVHNPGGAAEAQASSSAAGARSGPQPLPNYRNETLTLGLVAEAGSRRP